MDVSPGYRAADLERCVTEPDKPSGRSPFQRDRARVLHSAALRRLAAKTQVVVPWESDFPRTRLTHSLECAQVGRELGLALGCDPDLVETGCLAHDLGHPPFGHNGETALAEVAEPCGGFEGNAQSLRILVRLEAKAVAADGTGAGLNLTRAALDAATKYPWPRQDGLSKFGVYADDLPTFDWVRAGAPGERRCFEAQVMDWSDDVAYSVHDLEDAVQAGHLVLDVLHDRDERSALVALARCQYTPGAEPAAIEAALDRLLGLPFWPSRFDGSLRALAALKDTMSGLIGRFCRAAEEATRASQAGPLTRYGADLVVPDDVRLECGVLKAITARYVMQREGAPEAYERQREVVHELVHRLLLGAPATLEPLYREWFDRAPDDAARMRVVVDQVASLTDPGALALHGRLTGARRR